MIVIVSLFPPDRFQQDSNFSFSVTFRQIIRLNKQKLQAVELHGFQSLRIAALEKRYAFWSVSKWMRLVYGLVYEFSV
jgi:hypothetical protein